jgi:diacylglycerol O-acyltransferase
VRFKQILALLENRLHLSPIFRRKLVTVPGGVDRPYWVDDPDFDLEYHVRHIALPKPGDWRQLCILMSRLHSQPLTRDKPLWEIYIIEGLDNVEDLPPNCFALLMKVHHSAMDGATGAQFMNVMHDLEPTPVVHKLPDEPWTGEKITARKLLGKAYMNVWRKPGDTWRLAKQIIPAMRRISAGRKAQEFDNLDDKPETRFQGKISRHRVVDARKFDFEEVRAIKNTQPGTTINDVMLTIVAGGLRRYLDAKGELPEQSLVTGCPIDVRSDEERGAGGNMVGFMSVALHSNIADPVERLTAVHDSAVGAKIYAQALGPRIAMDITNVLPGNVLAVAMRAASSTGLTEASIMYNTIITNVPGAPFQLYFCGATLIDSISFGPLLPNMGLFHIVYSAVQNKKGTITLSFTACREMLPDPAFYAQCLQESFDELREATLGK